MIGLKLILTVVAIVLFVVAAIGVPAGRYSLVAAGLAFWAAADVAP